MPGPKVPDTGHVPKGWSARVADLDARERLGLRWSATTHLLTVLLLDKQTNRVRVRLGAGATAYEDEEVLKFLAEERAKKGPPPPWPTPGEHLPTFQKTARSPAVPDKTGIALAIDRVLVVPGAAELHGSFRLPIARRHVRDTEAVVPITLVITGSESAAPVVLPLQVPVAISSPAPAEVTGHFGLDLLSVPAMPRSAQTYFMYAFAGELLVGPVPFAFVDRGSLP
jgi:hypothetical protein